MPGLQLELPRIQEPHVNLDLFSASSVPVAPPWRLHRARLRSLRLRAWFSISNEGIGLTGLYSYAHLAYHASQELDNPRRLQLPEVI